MGTRKSYSIPMGMVFGKFYCHKCGEKLKNVPVLDRTVHPGDSGWLKESKIGNTHYLGSVEKYDYQFKCPSCGHEMDYSKQCTYKQIQKMLGKRVLSDQEIEDYLPAAKAAEKKKAEGDRDCGLFGYWCDHRADSRPVSAVRQGVSEDWP